MRSLLRFDCDASIVTHTQHQNVKGLAPRRARSQPAPRVDRGGDDLTASEPPMLGPGATGTRRQYRGQYRGWVLAGPLLLASCGGVDAPEPIGSATPVTTASPSDTTTSGQPSSTASSQPSVLPMMSSTGVSSGDPPPATAP